VNDELIQAAVGKASWTAKKRELKKKMPMHESKRLSPKLVKNIIFSLH
jgi:hypothetical protein